MKNRWLILSIATSLTAVPVWAGNTEGNGGTALVCRNTDGSIRTAELLDLFEAAEINHATVIRDPSTSVHLQANAALGRLQGFAEVFRHTSNYLSEVRARMQPIEFRYRLTPVGETLPPVVPAGCEYEVVVNYRPDGTILVDQTILDKFSPTDTAALYIHEAIYKLARTRNWESTDEFGSSQIRPLVAALFGPTPSEALLRRLVTTAFGPYNGHSVRVDPTLGGDVSITVNNHSGIINCNIHRYGPDQRWIEAVGDFEHVFSFGGGDSGPPRRAEVRTFRVGRADEVLRDSLLLRCAYHWSSNEFSPGDVTIRQGSQIIWSLGELGPRPWSPNFIDVNLIIRLRPGRN